MNLDSTQEILSATLKEDGMFVFKHEGKNIAEANIPSKMNADFIENWCNHVRNNMAALRPSDAELAARKERNRKHGPIEDSSPADGSELPGSTSTGPVGNLRTEEVRAFEESPDETARATVARLTERKEQLEAELKANNLMLDKWDAILTAIESIKDED